MPARICPLCKTPWPHNEVYKTVFGSTAVRSANTTCPACNVQTYMSPIDDALLPSAYHDTLETIAAQRRIDAAEQALDEYMISGFLDCLEGWLDHELV